MVTNLVYNNARWTWDGQNVTILKYHKGLCIRDFKPKQKSYFNARNSSVSDIVLQVKKNVNQFNGQRITKFFKLSPLLMFMESK